MAGGKRKNPWEGFPDRCGDCTAMAGQMGGGHPGRRIQIDAQLPVYAGQFTQQGRHTFVNNLLALLLALLQLRFEFLHPFAQHI